MTALLHQFAGGAQFGRADRLDPKQPATVRPLGRCIEVPDHACGWNGEREHGHAQGRDAARHYGLVAAEQHPHHIARQKFDLSRTVAEEFWNTSEIDDPFRLEQLHGIAPCPQPLSMGAICYANGTSARLPNTACATVHKNRQDIHSTLRVITKCEVVWEARGPASLPTDPRSCRSVPVDGTARAALKSDFDLRVAALQVVTQPGRGSWGLDLLPGRYALAGLRGREPVLSFVASVELRSCCANQSRPSPSLQGKCAAARCSPKNRLQEIAARTDMPMPQGVSGRSVLQENGRSPPVSPNVRRLTGSPRKARVMSAPKGSSQFGGSLIGNSEFSFREFPDRGPVRTQGRVAGTRGRKPERIEVNTAGTGSNAGYRYRARRHQRELLAPRLRRESGGVTPTAQMTRVHGRSAPKYKASGPCIEWSGRLRTHFTRRSA